MSTTKRCPKCQTGMERGFTPDFSYGAVLLGSWVDGEPAKGLLGNLKLKGRRKIDIVVYRCAGCGFLETYAPEP
jgi:hypothetical protein